MRFNLEAPTELPEALLHPGDADPEIGQRWHWAGSQRLAESVTVVSNLQCDPTVVARQLNRRIVTVRMAANIGQAFLNNAE